MGKVKFIEKSHQYLSDVGELISVSKFTDGFKEKVNWDEIARKSAAKATKAGVPTTKKQIQEKWAKKRDMSAQIGTLYHNIREQELIDEAEPVFYDVVCKKKVPDYDGADKLALPVSEIENNTVYPELMIYDFDYMICGQSDKVIVTDNTIHIWDYKTDAKLEFKGFSNDWVKVRKMLPPIAHLDDCNGVHYSLKMSLYMYLLWKANRGRFKPGDIIIEHITLQRDPENDNIPVLDAQGLPVVLKIEKIKLPYRKKEVIAMLEHYKKNKK